MESSTLTVASMGHDTATNDQSKESESRSRSNLLTWLQVVASLLINMNNLGFTFSFGPFQTYYQENLLKNHTSSEIAWIGTVQGALVLIVGIISGPLFDRGYWRLMLIPSSIGIVVFLMLLSISTEYWAIMLTQGILSGICGGVLYVPATAIIPLHFPAGRMRGLALGLGTSGSSLAGVIYPIMFRRLLNAYGFAWATRGMGFFSLVTLSIAILLSRHTGARPPTVRKVLDTGALKEPHFLAFMFAALLFFCCQSMPFFLAPAFAESIGVNANLAFYLVAILNAAAFFGRIVPAATLAARVGAETLVVAATVMLSIAGFAWISVHTQGSFITFLVMWGIGSGMITTLPALVVATLAPSLAVYGTRLGMVYGSAGFGLLISVPVATAIAADTGGFLGAQIWTGCCASAGTVVFLVPFWKARQKRLAAKEKVDDELEVVASDNISPDNKSPTETEKSTV